MFENTEEFYKTSFGDNLERFSEFTPLSDVKVGFSVKSEYPSGIRFKPAKTRDGRADSLAVIWVVYADEEDSSTKVPVSFRIERFNLYRARNFDYDFTDENCPTKESLEASNASPSPVGLEYRQDYFFDHESNSFVDSKGNKKTGQEILDKVFDDHCNTVHLLKGVKLRFQLLMQSKVTGVLGLVVTLLEYFLKKVFGRTFEESDSLSAFYKGYDYSNFKKLNEDSLNVFGYKAAKSVIVLFCLIVVSVSLYRYFNGISGGYLAYISKSNLLSVVHALLLLWLLDTLVPFLMFKFVNLILWARRKVAFAKFKVG